MEKNKMESKVRKALRTLGVPQHILGYEYITTATVLGLEDKSYIRDITKRLYPAIAECHKTTPSRVERAIRHAVEVSFDNIPYELMGSLFGNTWSAKRGRPTNSHYLAALIENIPDDDSALWA